MQEAIALPVVNENGYYEIRLESIGGLGANLCGKLLGELGAVYLGLNSASFSSYGSEKRGSPVRAYIRWSAPERELRINCPVENPQLLGLFHENMAGAMSVTAGADEHTKVVVNTHLSPVEMRKTLRLAAGELYCIDAQETAMACKSRINMVMLGALAKASGFIPLEPVLQLVKDTMGKKYPELLEQNLEGVRQGYDNVKWKAFEQDGSYEPVPYRETQSGWGYENAPVGGTNPHIGSSVSNDLSASREGYIPLFIPERCINCGLCDTTCPDMVFQFKEGEYKGKKAMVNTGLDYHHCKGCLRCVDVCPVEALVAGLEREHPEKKYFVRNKDLIADSIDFDAAGADGWITSEAYLDEKRVDGGMV